MAWVRPSRGWSRCQGPRPPPQTPVLTAPAPPVPRCQDPLQVLPAKDWSWDDSEPAGRRGHTGKLLCRPEDTEGEMAPPFRGRAACEQGQAQTQDTVTRAADGGDPGGSWSSLMYPGCPLRSANTRDPHKEACGAQGPAAWSPHRDTTLPLPPTGASPLPTAGGRALPKQQSLWVEHCHSDLPTPQDRPQHSPLRWGPHCPQRHPLSACHVRTAYIWTQTLDPDGWLPTRWGLALRVTAVSPAPTLSSQPPVSTLCGGGTRAISHQVASSHSPCSCDCLRPPAVRTEETGPGRWASGQAAPGLCWQEEDSGV